MCREFAIFRKSDVQYIEWIHPYVEGLHKVYASFKSSNVNFTYMAYLHQYLHFSHLGSIFPPFNLMGTEMGPFLYLSEPLADYHFFFWQCSLLSACAYLPFVWDTMWFFSETVRVLTRLYLSALSIHFQVTCFHILILEHQIACYIFP